MSYPQIVWQALQKPGSLDEVVERTGLTRQRVNNAVFALRQRGMLAEVGRLPSSQGSPQKVWKAQPAKPKQKEAAMVVQPSSVFHLGAIITRDRAAWVAVNDSFYRDQA